MFKSSLGHRIAFVDKTLAADQSSGRSQVLAALADTYGSRLRGGALTPPPEPLSLRQRILRASPPLADLTEAIRSRFREGASAVVVPSLGIANEPLDTKRQIVFALAAALGLPTATEPVTNTVIWDVRNRELDPRQRQVTFSETDREALYHTDSQFAVRPEKYFLLYAVHGAQCGGGLSLLRDGELEIERLRDTARGEAAYSLLSEHAVPTRVPPSFSRFSYTGEHQYATSTVFSRDDRAREPDSGVPLWRWRQDTIEAGLAAYPEQATVAIREAVHYIGDFLRRPADEARLHIATDGLLLVDNHRALHGRTPFSDQRRHLLRIRFNDA